MDVTSLTSQYERSSDNSSTTDSQPYDNAKPLIEYTTPADQQHTTSNLHQSTAGVPAAGGESTCQAPASPRYDRVANRMENSVESNHSERIYAEVLEPGLVFEFETGSVNGKFFSRILPNYRFHHTRTSYTYIIQCIYLSCLLITKQ